MHPCLIVMIFKDNLIDTTPTSRLRRALVYCSGKSSKKEVFPLCSEKSFKIECRWDSFNCAETASIGIEYRCEILTWVQKSSFGVEYPWDGRCSAVDLADHCLVFVPSYSVHFLQKPLTHPTLVIHQKQQIIVANVSL